MWDRQKAPGLWVEEGIGSIQFKRKKEWLATAECGCKSIQPSMKDAIDWLRLHHFSHSTDNDW